MQLKLMRDGIFRNSQDNNWRALSARVSFQSSTVVPLLVCKCWPKLFLEINSLPDNFWQTFRNIFFHKTSLFAFRKDTQESLQCEIKISYQHFSVCMHPTSCEDAFEHLRDLRNFAEVLRSWIDDNPLQGDNFTELRANIVYPNFGNYLTWRGPATVSKSLSRNPFLIEK